jgi:threonine/homoserine/homoserine lactone efflux protein
MTNELLLFALIFTASAITPGPDTMTIFGRALAGGRFAALPFSIGVIMAKLTLLTLVILGLATTAQAFGQYFIWLKFAGAAYLLYAGIKLWRKSGEVEAHALAPQASWRDAVTGYALGISNPQAIVFYVALLPTAVDMHNINMAMYLALSAVLVGLMVVVASIYALLAERLRLLLRSPAARRASNRVAGGVMVAAGVVVATR